MPIESRPEFRPPGVSPPQYPIPPAYTPPPPVYEPQTAQMTQLPDNILGYFMLLLGL